MTQGNQKQGKKQQKKNKQKDEGKKQRKKFNGMEMRKKGMTTHHPQYKYTGPLPNKKDEEEEKNKLKKQQKYQMKQQTFDPTKGPFPPKGFIPSQCGTTTTNTNMPITNTTANTTTNTTTDANTNKNTTTNTNKIDIHEKRREENKAYIQKQEREHEKEAKEGKYECIICIENTNHIAIYEKCYHEDVFICWQCAVHLRCISKNKTCPVCKTESEKVVVTQKPESYEKIEAKKKIRWQKEYDIGITEPHFEHRINYIYGTYCRECYYPTRTRKELQKHMKRFHKLQYCTVCLDHRKTDIGNQILYTNAELKYHMNFGKTHKDIGETTMHPECLYCNTYYYNEEALFKHLHEKHEKCSVCDLKVRRFDFFRNYEELKKHHAEAHCPCPLCPHIVFDSEIELNHHVLKTHANELSKKERDEIKKNTRAYVHLAATEGLQAVDAKLENVRYMNLPPSIKEQKAQQMRRIERAYENQQKQQAGPTRQEVMNAFTSNKQTIKYTPVTNTSPTTNVTNKTQHASSTATTTTAEKMEHQKVLMQKIKTLEPYERKQIMRNATALQNGEMKVMDYYESYVNFFGYQQMKKLFPHLIGSLPSNCSHLIPALRATHQTYKDKAFRGARKQSKKKQEVEDFPVLGGGNQAGDGSWGRIVERQRKSKRKAARRRAKETDFPPIGMTKGKKARR